MTHTLHRRGDDGSLAGDWVVLAMAAQGVNSAGAAPRLRAFLELALRYRPVNLGDMRQGSRFDHEVEALLDGIGESSIVHAVLTTAEDVADLLAALRSADLGVSVVVSGPVGAVRCACRKAGIAGRRRTVLRSLGAWGATALLPPEEVLEVTTMCGHGLLAASLVEATVAAVRAGQISVREGAERLAAPCVCGVFNPERAAALLAAMAGRAEAE